MKRPIEEQRKDWIPLSGVGSRTDYSHRSNTLEKIVESRSRT